VFGKTVWRMRSGRAFRLYGIGEAGTAFRKSERLRLLRQTLLNGSTPWPRQFRVLDVSSATLTRRELDDVVSEHAIVPAAVL
jgi:hypothetical protein